MLLYALPDFTRLTVVVPQNYINPVEKFRIWTYFDDPYADNI